MSLIRWPGPCARRQHRSSLLPVPCGAPDESLRRYDEQGALGLVEKSRQPRSSPLNEGSGHRDRDHRAATVAECGFWSVTGARARQRCQPRRSRRHCSRQPSGGSRRRCGCQRVS